MARLELIGLRKRYGGVTAVDDISLVVEHGEIVSLLGPSGCGKTTTLNMLAGFLVPDEGSILVDGKPVHDLPPERRNTGMVFQNYALFPHLTVAGNIAFGLEMRKVARADMAPRIARAVALSRLTGFEERYPRELSGGQQQRVALARALVVEPSLLLLDEPLSNLDAALREEMRFEIREIQRRVGITTVFVTHDQTEAMAISSRLAVMNKGRIVQAGTPEEIYRMPADAFVARFIGQANLLRGIVAERTHDGALVEIEGGQRVRVANAGTIAAGQRVEIVIRPEDLVVAPAADGANRMQVALSEVTYLGAATRLVATLGGQTLTIMSNRPRLAAKQGELIDVAWDPAHGALIPRAD
jgi:putative spermidine/putrescine transport system ATP-binding protein